MDTSERILRELARGKPHHIRELARLTKLHPTTVTTAVDKLVNGSILLKRHNSEVNRTYVQFAANLKAKNQRVRINITRLIESGLIDALNEQYAFPTIFLFGSIAKGENHSTSDVDLFIIANDTSNFDVTMYETKLGYPIQMFVHTQSEFKKLCETSPQLINNVLNGIKLDGYVEVFE